MFSSSPPSFSISFLLQLLGPLYYPSGPLLSLRVVHRLIHPRSFNKYDRKTVYQKYTPAKYEDYRSYTDIFDTYVHRYQQKFDYCTEKAKKKPESIASTWSSNPPCKWTKVCKWQRRMQKKIAKTIEYSNTLFGCRVYYIMVVID